MKCGVAPWDLAGLEQSVRAQQVDLDRCVERAVEADGGGRVDDDVAAAEQLEVLWRTARARRRSHRRTPLVMRRLQMSSEVAAPGSRAGARRRRCAGSRAATRRFTSVRRPGRTSSTRSQSGTERSSRSTSAVPKKPVAPVMAMRFAANASAITTCCLAPTMRQIRARPPDSPRASGQRRARRTVGRTPCTARQPHDRAYRS